MKLIQNTIKSLSVTPHLLRRILMQLEFQQIIITSSRPRLNNKNEAININNIINKSLIDFSKMIFFKEFKT